VRRQCIGARSRGRADSLPSGLVLRHRTDVAAVLVKDIKTSSCPRRPVVTRSAEARPTV